jgi:hypothetical protein
MRGNIRIKSLEVETNENGNYIIYGQHEQDGHSQKIELRPLPQLTSQMCLVYDATTSTFVPQDLSTYVDNTPIFKNKIKEVAGTATLVAPDGTSLVASVEIYTTESYLPQVNNTVGDIAFAQDTQKLYIWDGSVWIQAAASIDLSSYDTSSEVDTKISNIPGVDLSSYDTSSEVDTKISNTSSTTDLFVTLRQSGELSVITGLKRWYAPKNINISKLVARVDTAPTGASINITIKKNGSSAATLVIFDGGTKIINSSPSITMVDDDYITVDITQIGSSTTGSNLTITFTYS